MARRSDALSLALPPRDPRAPVRRWLGAALRAAILEGRLRPGARLPAHPRPRPAARALARHHRCGVRAARAEGYLEGRVGSGTYVSRTLPDDLLQVARRRRARALHRAAATVAPRTRVERGPAVRQRRPGTRARVPDRPAGAGSLSHHAVGPGRRLAGSAGDGRSAHGAVRPRDIGRCRGRRRLPRHVARRALRARRRSRSSLGCRRRSIWSARLVLESGRPVCMEDPGYPGARRGVSRRWARTRHGRRSMAKGCVPPARDGRARAGLRDAGAPVPARRGDEPAAPARRCSSGRAPRAPASSRTTTTASSVSRPAVPALQGLDRARRGDLRRQLQQGALPFAAPRLPRAPGRIWSSGLRR